VKPKKLFHTIVIVGAALTSSACGDGDDATDTGAADSSVADSGADSATDGAIADASDATTMLDSMMPSDGGADADADTGMVIIL